MAAFRCGSIWESESEAGNGGSISCTGLVYQSGYAYLQVVEGLTATYLPTQPRDRAVYRFCIFLPTDSTKMDCYVVLSSIAGGLASTLPAGLKGVVCSVRRGEDGFQHDGFGSLRRGSRPVDHWPRLGQARDLISECLRLTNCRPDGVGRPALGKVSRKTASRHMNECTRFRCPICTVIIVGTEYRVERTRAGDSLRRDDPSRARAERQPHLGKKPTTPAAVVTAAGTMVIFFSLSQNSIWGGRGPKGFLEKTGSGTDNSIAPQGPRGGWLAGKWLRGPGALQLSERAPFSRRLRESLRLALGNKRHWRTAFKMSTFLGDSSKGPRRRSSDRAG